MQDEKARIEQQKAVIGKAKLMADVIKSEHSCEETMAFIKGGTPEDDE